MVAYRTELLGRSAIQSAQREVDAVERALAAAQARREIAEREVNALTDPGRQARIRELDDEILRLETRAGDYVPAEALSYGASREEDMF